jgi:DNA-binding transcriptional regulator YhcF (GntR family)
MNTHPLFQTLHLDDHSATPKYQQLANCIIQNIQSGKIKKNELLPSLNELSFNLEISRDTAEKGYKYLKQLGLLGSTPGKGYFIKNTEVVQPLKIFLLFNKLSAHKKIIYDSFVKKLDNKATIDFYIYNNDFSLFKRLLSSKLGLYDYYVIIPHFIEGGERAYEVINEIDKSKLILLDKILPNVNGNFSAVYENFEKDIYQSLGQSLSRLMNYQTMKLIFPEHSYFPNEIIKGFVDFCQQYAFNHKIVHNIEVEELNKGEVYINLMENDLVTLIERALKLNLVIGKEIGIISYNETSLKKIILNGITTISSDFELMGEKAAALVLDQRLAQEEVPFHLTLRASL